jgi:hypothetical protein
VSRASLAAGEGLDNAVAQWAKKISSHLALDEVAHVTWKEAGASDPGSALYLTRAKALLARALQRRLKNPKVVEIVATLSHNLKDDLLVAEVQHEDNRAVEIVSLPRAAASAPPTAGFRLGRRLLWEQETQILDVAADPSDSSQMLVLDTTGLTRYERHELKWQRSETLTLEIPPVRDPRGRLSVAESAATAEVAGLICQGSWKPALIMECQPGGRFTAGRNTIEEAGWPAYFSHAEIGGDHVVVAADGKTLGYASARKPAGTPEAWEDIAVVSSTCAGAKILAVDSPAKALVLFDLVNHNPVRASDAAELPGSITALWPAGNAALAVVRNKNTNRYEAYTIAVDCGR